MAAKQVKSRQRVADHGEVFTAEREVKAMLDLVKQETERIDSRFLEPACGDGNFLAEILRRKLAAVKKKYGRFPADYEKYAVLAVSSIYGVDILQDNIAACRKRLFQIWNKEYTGNCKKEANEECRKAVRFILSKNIICGDALCMKRVDSNGNETDEPIVFSEWSFVLGLNMQRRDYRFDKLLEAKEGIFHMRFDVIIGNPPYQLSDGGNGVSASPIYQKFVEQAIKLKPRYLSMIVPSRYFAGGKGLDAFREAMLNDRHLVKIVDFINAKDCFPQNSISGGVNYFLWDRDHEGDCEFTTVSGGGRDTQVRKLNEFPTFVRYNRAVAMIHKIRERGGRSLSDIVSSRNPYGIPTSARGNGKAEAGDILLYSSKGIGYVKPEEIVKGHESVHRYKVMVSRITSEHAGEPDKKGKRKVLSKIQVLKPNEICTDSYLAIGCFDTQEEAENLRQYLTTRFARFLISQTLSSINLSKDKFSFVPYIDFKKRFSEKQLYAEFGLSDEDIKFIKSLIHKMD